MTEEEQEAAPTTDAPSPAHLGMNQPRFPRFHSATFKAAAFVASHPFATVAGIVVLAVVSYFVARHFGTLPSLPRQYRVIATFAIPAVLLGRPVATWVADLLDNQPLVVLVDLQAEDPAHGSVIAMTIPHFRQFEVTGGALDWVAPDLAFCRDVNLEEKTLEGTWRGTLTDRELLLGLTMVKECRDETYEKAQKADIYEMHGWNIVNKQLEQGFNVLIDTLKTGKMPDKGLTYDDTLRDALGDFDVEAEFEKLIRSREGPADDLAEFVEPEGSGMDDLLERAQEQSEALQNGGAPDAE